MSSFKQLVVALEHRYDYISARSLAKVALSDSGIEKKAKFDPKEMKAIVEALGAMGSGMDKVWQALEMAPRGIKVGKAEAPKAAEPEAAEAAADEAPSEETLQKEAPTDDGGGKKKAAAKKKK